MSNNIYADLSALHHKYSVKRSGQSRAEYAAAVQAYRKPAATRLVFIFCALMVSAAWLGASV